MPQIHSAQDSDNSEEKAQPAEEQPEKRPVRPTLSLPSIPTNTTGRMPIILLSGPHPSIDTRKLSAYAHKSIAPVRLEDAVKSKEDTTSRMLVITPDEKLKQKRLATQARIEAIRIEVGKSRTNRRATMWTAVVLISLGLTLLFTLFFSNTVLFPDQPLNTTKNGSGMMCDKNCQAQAMKVYPHIGGPGNTGAAGSPGNAGSSANPVSTPMIIPTPVPVSTGPLPSAIDSSWKLTFDDEFTNGYSPAWQNGGANWGSGGGGEEQTYLASECSASNGVLQLRADHTSAQGKPYTSCMLNTIGTFQQTYGYFECRAQIPQGQGFWPAFWLYNTDFTSYEIDTMENLGNDPSTYYMTYHAPSGSHQGVYHGVNLAGGYHTYAVKWTPNAITYYLDGNALFTTTSDVYTGPMYLFVNFAVGGNWPGSPNASTAFPNYFNVDYIKAYSMP